MAKNCVFSKLSEKSPAKVWSCEILIVPLHPQMRKAPSATTHGVLVQLVRMPACHAGGHEFESRTHRFHIATNGALVQLVRMPACHAGGHEFESRTHRKKHPQKGCFFVLYIVYLLGKQLGIHQIKDKIMDQQLDQINYRKWNYQKSQKGGSQTGTALCYYRIRFANNDR